MSRRPSTFALAITDAQEAVKRSDLSRSTPAETAELRSALRALIQAVETLAESNGSESRACELETALRPFVIASEKWSERNRSGWRDEECGTLDGAGNPVEWFAEIEVSNRDVLAAKAVLVNTR